MQLTRAANYSTIERGTIKLNQLGLFAKFWEPGKVKTRLAKTVGPIAASRIYRLFLQHLIDEFSTNTLQAKVELNLVFSPADSGHKFSEIAPDWNLMPQSGGDLGQRMEACFRDLLSRALDPETGTSKSNRAATVVIIGSDTPDLSSEAIVAAHEILLDHDVVIGPSTDGGYYLIGVRNKMEDTDRLTRLFEGISWSTPSVFAQTVDRIENCGASYSLLEPMNDIDELDDLRQFLSIADDQHTSLIRKLQNIAGEYLAEHE